jgi:Ser-tRNA(Ala) deacylase AlaX
MSASRWRIPVFLGVSAELKPESEVTIGVDWNRRFDHMQCHSTQHLISAVARQKFGLKTLSWWLASAPQECHIELDGVITPEQVAEVEEQCNEWIRRGACRRPFPKRTMVRFESSRFKGSISIYAAGQ